MKQFTLISILIMASILIVEAQSNEHSQELDNQIKEALGTEINTTYQEVRPLISQDGKTLFFCRRNHPQNVKGEQDFQDVWFTKLDDKGNWITPHNMGSVINNEKANGICSISEDGNTGLFYNTYERVNLPLAFSVNTKGEWSVPQPLEIEDYYNHSPYSDFYYSFEQKVLIMAVDRTDGKGDQDLFVSFMEEDGTFTRPVSMGSMNTSKADFAPFLAADGKTLFFASYGHMGRGGADIYVTRRLDNSWQKWGPVENLGAAINSGNDELYFSITADFQYIYMESYKQGSIERNLSRVKLPEELKLTWGLKFPSLLNGNRTLANK